LLAVLAILCAAPAFAQSAAEKSGVNSLIGAAPRTKDFIKEAATSDMFEIASSKLALERADAPTKSFAQTMIADHHETTDELKQLIAQKNVNVQPPAEMTSSQESMLNQLKQLKGGSFTKQYHSDQVSAHKDAVDLFKRYGNGGENADLRAWALKTEPSLERHLQMAQDLNK
jgi:putative membrane protein